MTMTIPPFYTALVHEAEEGGYWAEVVELPGCVSQGETLDELRQNIREAIEAVLAASAESSGATVREPQARYDDSVARATPTSPRAATRTRKSGSPSRRR